MFEHCSSPGRAHALQPLSSEAIAYVVAATTFGITFATSPRRLPERVSIL